MEEVSKEKKIEIFLRVLAITVGSFTALIAASVALGTFEDDFAPIFEKYKDEFKDELREIRGPTSSVIVITAVAIVIETAVILTRLRSVSINIKELLIIVIIIEILLMAGHIAVGVSTAYYADEHILDKIKNAGSFTVPEEFTRLGNSMTTAAAFCFVAVFLFGLLVIWEIKFLVSEWNESMRNT